VLVKLFVISPMRLHPLLAESGRKDARVNNQSKSSLIDLNHLR
jgi:hypothetical protein